MKHAKVMFLFSVFITVLLALGISSAGAQGWYNTSWTNRRVVTISNPGSTALTDYQVQIVLNSSFDFTRAKSDGSDLRVTSNDGTTLIPFWIENWDAGTQQASIWVKVPMIDGGGSTVFLYYGNPAPTLPSSSPVEVPPTGPFTRAAANPIAPLGATGSSLLAENIVYDDVTNHYWICLANYSESAISLAYSDNPTDPSSWVWAGNAIPHSSIAVYYSGSPHLVKDGGTWYLFYTDRPNIRVATSTSIAGPYTIDPTPILSPSGSYPAWDNFRVDEPYVFKRASDNKWIMIYMGDQNDGGPTEQVGYAVADNITGPYTAYANNPVIRFGTAGSFDAGTIADPWVYYFQGTYYIGYTVSPTKYSPWYTALATTTDWDTFTKQGVVLPLASSGWDASNSFRGAVTRIGDTYVFSYTGDSYRMGIATQPAYMAPPNVVNNVDAVFDFYDGFSGSSLDASKWSFNRGTISQATVSGGNLTLTSTTNNFVAMMSLSTFGPGYLMETRARHPMHGTANMVMELGFNANFGDMVRIVDDFPPAPAIPNPTATWNRQAKLNGETGEPHWSAMAQAADQNWHTFTLFRTSGSSTTAGYQIDNSTVETATSYVPTSWLPIFFMSYTEGSTDQVVVDWARVRKWAGANAGASVGSEESASGVAETKTCNQVGTIYNFTNSGVSITFGVLPQAGSDVTIRRYLESPPSPSYPNPPAGSTYLPVWYDITSTLANNSFSVTVTMNVAGISGFGSDSKLMYYNSTSSKWVLVRGTYNGSTHEFTFTTTHFTAFAFINSTAIEQDFYLSTSATASTSSIVAPNADWDGGYPGRSNDWGFTGTQAVNLYVVPQVGTMVGACDLFVEWDNTVLSLDAVSFSGSIFSGGDLLYAASDRLGTANLVRINAALKSPVNVTVASGHYVACLQMRLIKPGHSAVSIIGEEVLTFNDGSSPTKQYITPQQAEVKAYLGDVASPADQSNGDGLIQYEDLAAWSSSYWSGTGSYDLSNYKAKFDIGPTQDHSFFSLPVVGRGAQIDFEDLMIFSMGYHLSASHVLPKVPAPSEELLNIYTGAPTIAGGQTYLPVHIAGNVADVRGISLVLKGQFGKFLGAGKGALLAGYATPVALMSRSEGQEVFIDLALLGLNATALHSAGEVVVLRFEGKAQVGIATVECRDSRNQMIASREQGKGSEIPTTYSLEQNYPNPFNPSTTITYAVPVAGEVRLDVYDVLGQHIASLVNGAREAGYHDVQWDGKNSAGRQMASGIYIYRVQAGQFSAAKKMILMK
jgi:hypothetical protein